MSSGVDLLASPRSETVILSRGGRNYNAVMVGLAALAIVAGIASVATLVLTTVNHQKSQVKDGSTSAAIKMVELSSAQIQEENKNIKEGNKTTQKILKDIKETNQMKHYANLDTENLMHAIQSGVDLAKRDSDSKSAPTYQGVITFEDPKIQEMYIQFLKVSNLSEDEYEEEVQECSRRAVKYSVQLEAEMKATPGYFSKEYSESITACTSASCAQNIVKELKDSMSLSVDQKSGLETLEAFQMKNTHCFEVYHNRSELKHAKLKGELLLAMKVAMDYPLHDSKRKVAVEYMHYVARLLVEVETLRQSVRESMMMTRQAYSHFVSAQKAPATVQFETAVNLLAQRYIYCELISTNIERMDITTEIMLSDTALASFKPPHMEVVLMATILGEVYLSDLREAEMNEAKGSADKVKAEMSAAINSGQAASLSLKELKLEAEELLQEYREVCSQQNGEMEPSSTSQPRVSQSAKAQVLLSRLQDMEKAIGTAQKLTQSSEGQAVAAEILQSISVSRQAGIKAHQQSMAAKLKPAILETLIKAKMMSTMLLNKLQMKLDVIQQEIMLNSTQLKSADLIGNEDNVSVCRQKLATKQTELEVLEGNITQLEEYIELLEKLIPEIQSDKIEATLKQVIQCHLPGDADKLHHTSPFRSEFIIQHCLKRKQQMQEYAESPIQFLGVSL